MRAQCADTHTHTPPSLQCNTPLRAVMGRTFSITCVCVTPSHNSRQTVYSLVCCVIRCVVVLYVVLYVVVLC